MSRSEQDASRAGDAAGSPMGSIAISPSTREGTRFAPLEVHVDLGREYRNPFDPGEIELWAEFVAPSGRDLTVPGFYGQEHRLVQGAAEATGASSEEGSGGSAQDRLAAAGPPGWRVCFTPCEEGTYRYRVFARDREGVRCAQEAELRVSGSAGHGFVRVDPSNSAYFRFDDGAPFIPVGYDYSVHTDLTGYREHFRVMESCGANWMYVIIDPFDIGMEWGRRPPGRYDLESCSRLDCVLEYAREHGIMVLLSFNCHADTMPKNERGLGWWEEHPYNAANGGPCETGDDFFRNEEAKALYRRRIRYIVARWGHHPNVFGWLPVTELEGSALWHPDSVDKDLNLRTSWYLEMARYLKEIDPYGHLVSPSLAVASLGSALDRRLFGDPVTDFTQPHMYLFEDFAETVDYWCRRHRKELGKPVFVTEFGPTHMVDESSWDYQRTKEYLEQDQAMLHYHDGLWAAFFGGGAGTVIHWYWQWVERSAGLDHVRAISSFLKALDWRPGGYQAADPLVAHRPEVAPGEYEDLVVAPGMDAGVTQPWVEAEPVYVRPDGRAAGFPTLRRRLYSRGRRQGWEGRPLTPPVEPPEFHVTLPQGGALEVTVSSIEGDSARLAISEGERTLLDEGLAGRSFPCRFQVSLPAGAQRLLVENSDPGESVMRVTSYRFPGCRETRWAPLIARPLRGDGEWLLWIARADLRDEPPGAFPSSPVKGAALHLADLPPGRYRVEWWDTYEGQVVQREEAASAGDGVSLSLPPVLRDVACRLTLLPGS